VDAPHDLVVYLGALVVGVVVPETIRRYLARGDKVADAHRAEQERADVEWRAEVRADLKRLLDGQARSDTSVKLLEQRQSNIEGRLEQLEKRQTAQADAHLAAIERLRNERKRR